MKGVHPTAIIGPQVQLGTDVSIGPFTLIDGDVTIGNGTQIGSHCLLCGQTDAASAPLRIGARCVVRSHSIIYDGCRLAEGVQTGHRVTLRSGCDIGAHCMIGTGCDLQGDLRVGRYSRLHSDVHLCQGSDVGSYVFIYPRVTFTNDRYPPSHTTMAPTVADYTQVGAGSMLMPGVRIGKNCLVAAMSLVNSDFEDDSFLKGTPARRVGRASEMRERDEVLYPWPQRFDRNMPWQGIDFDQWTEREA